MKAREGRRSLQKAREAKREAQRRVEWLIENKRMPREAETGL